MAEPPDEFRACAAMAKCGSVWVMLVGISISLMTLSIGWVWDTDDDVSGRNSIVTEAVVFGSVGLILFLSSSFSISHGANNLKVSLLRIGGALASLSYIFCIVGFGYWLWWTLHGRGIDNDNHINYRSKVINNLAIAIDVFYGVAICTFAGAIRGAVQLADALANDVRRQEGRRGEGSVDYAGDCIYPDSSTATDSSHLFGKSEGEGKV